VNGARVIRGVGVSPGVVVAPAMIVQWDFPEVPDRAVRPDQVENEVKRLREAVAELVSHLNELGQKVLRRAGPEEARIFDAQILMAQDEEFLSSVEFLIRAVGVCGMIISISSSPACPVSLS
jgi:phosphotransferase system enzyme I (PtsI)